MKRRREKKFSLSLFIIISYLLGWPFQQFSEETRLIGGEDEKGGDEKHWKQFRNIECDLRGENGGWGEGGEK